MTTIPMDTLIQVQKPVAIEDVLELIWREAAAIPYERVYFTMKKMQVKPLKFQTVETMRLCLVIHRLGLSITAPMVAGLRSRKQNTATDALHILGDKKCLTLLRGSKKRFSRWIVSPRFLQHFESDLSHE